MSGINEEADAALRGVRQKIGKMLEKDGSVKVSMYAPSKEKRNDGDTWTDHDGKKWEMKNGIAQSISSLQGAKRPWWCPECGKTMRGKADDRMWALFGKCHHCVSAEETQRRINGTWQLFQRLKMVENSIAYVEDHLDQFRDLKETLANPQNHFMDGRWEEWKMDLDSIKEDLDFEIDRFEGRINELQEIKNGVTKLLEECEQCS